MKQNFIKMQDILSTYEDMKSIKIRCRYYYNKTGINDFKNILESNDINLKWFKECRSSDIENISDYIILTKQLFKEMRTLYDKYREEYNLK